MNKHSARAKCAQILITMSCVAASGLACAQSGYPDRPIRLIVPYPPGSSTNDILGRALAGRLTVELGQQVVVDNRSGASGNMGSELVAKSAPDGYTLLIGVAGPLAVGPSVYTNLGYVPTRGTIGGSSMHDAPRWISGTASTCRYCKATIRWRSSSRAAGCGNSSRAFRNPSAAHSKMTIASAWRPRILPKPTAARSFPCTVFSSWRNAPGDTQD